MDDRKENTLDPITGGPVLTKTSPAQSLIAKTMRFTFMSLIAVTVMPLVSVYWSISRLGAFSDVFRKVFLNAPLRIENVKPPQGEEEKVWGSTIGKLYARAIEYQIREGYCSSTTTRCMLRSYNISLPSNRHLPIPAAIAKPDTPEGVQSKILTQCVSSNGTPRLEVTICRGSNVPGATEEEHYEEFLKALRLINHPSGLYRVGANFLRGALFGPAGYWPGQLMIAFFGGHFSPLIGLFESSDPRNPTVALFDVNDAWGLVMVPARRMFAAVRTADLMTSQTRGLVITKLLD
jgi:hypothetical protein